MSKLIFCVTTICLLTAVPVRADDVKVFLLGGQSNMVGSGQQADLPTELQSPQNDLLYYLDSSLTTLRPRSNGGFVRENGKAFPFIFFITTQLGFAESVLVTLFLLPTPHTP